MTDRSLSSSYSRPKKGRAILGWALLAVLLLWSGKHFAGYHFFARYEKLSATSKSIEQDFSALERDLKTAVRFSKNPEFFGELGQLYFKRALGENQSGSAEMRDRYCDQARQALTEQIMRNPADARGFYQLGLVMMLYNYPLLTYRDKGRIYLKRAVDLIPGDEYICANVIAIFISQWDELDAGERQTVFSQFVRERDYPASFLGDIQAKVIKNTGSDVKFKEALRQDPGIWEKLKKYFQ